MLLVETIFGADIAWIVGTILVILVLSMTDTNKKKKATVEK